jgi:hypothetical protein|uniref:C2H2-type domain-containing protein n=1 Tax=viral metagenome TaxID=1070528 RepID=A0A6C0IKF7_9ZZZZ
MPKEYFCEVCNYRTNRKSSYEKHIVSAKHHIKTANMIKETHIQADEEVDTQQLTCRYCSRVLSSIRGKTKHENRCKYKPEDINKNVGDYDDVKISTTENLDNKVNDVISSDLLKNVVEQNAQLIKLLTETKTPTTINNTTNNSNTTNYNTLNSTNNFNLQVFLNEDCKDAMNLMDFVNSLKYKIEDLENTGKSGYVEGISKLMLDGLKGMEITQRPIHCTDIKRDSVYVKDNDEWQRDNNKDKLTNAIKYVANNNLKVLPKWTDKNPQHKDFASETHRTYMKIVNEASGGGTDEEDEKNMKKIIKKVAAETVIDK